MRTERSNCARRYARGPSLLLVLLAVLLLAVAGCQTLPIPSARFACVEGPMARQPTLAEPPAPVLNAPPAAEEVYPAQDTVGDATPADSPVPLVPTDASVPQSDTLQPVTDPTLAPQSNVVADEPFEPADTVRADTVRADTVGASCGDRPYDGPIRRLRSRISHCQIWCRMGPLFCHDAPYDPQALAEAELQPPFSRFHPVPTAPVFAPRYDYQQPQLMMVPLQPSKKLVPQLLTPRRAANGSESSLEDGDLVPEPESAETIPLPESTLDSSPTAQQTPNVALNWRAVPRYR